MTSLQIEHPGFNLEDKESLDTLMKIIYQLPETQKSALILTRIEELPQKEVAEIMNCSVKAVEGLLQRAKKNIAKELALAKEINR